MELTFEQKLAAILSVGSLGTEDGKFTFTPEEEQSKIFGIKKGWYKCNPNLAVLVDSMFDYLISVEKPSI